MWSTFQRHKNTISIFVSPIYFFCFCRPEMLLQKTTIYTGKR